MKKNLLQSELISIKSISCIYDFERIRKLRNSNSIYMTGISSEIPLSKQLIFIIKHLFSNNNIFVIYLNDKFVGYLYMKFLKDRYILSFVVDYNFRNRGIGDIILKFAISKYNFIQSDIFNNNFSSIRLHEKNGFKLISSSGDINTYVFN